MSCFAHIPRRCLPALVLALGALLAATPSAGAQSPALYSLNSSGLLSVNATQLDDLPGSSWVSMVIDGSDRYALKKDGTVYMNGLELYKLKCTSQDDDDVDEGDWVGITLYNGDLWALSEFGYLAVNGTCQTQLSTSGFVFTAIITGPTGTWELRSDGAVFQNTDFASVFALDGGLSLSGAAQGTATDTTFESATIGPDSKVWALRNDGKIVRGDITFEDPSPGTVIAGLPYSLGDTLYVDIAFDFAGQWLVLRSNGEVYQDPNTLNPLIDFSGSDFVDLLPLPESMSAGTTDMSFMALRKDGDLFRETGEDVIYDLDKSGYCCLALSLDPPDLMHIDNSPPVVAQYSTQAIVDTSLQFPILATDTDLAAADLVVTVDQSVEPFLTLGATYDDMTRVVEWDSPVKGSYKVKLTVSDGVNKDVKSTQSIKVSDADTNPEKNKPPKVSKIKKVQGLVGIELALPILAVDPDGDPLTITVDDTLEPYTLGATFDAMTSTFVWADPDLSHIGKYKLEFLVSDGIKTVKLKVTIEIVASLLTI